MPAQHRGRSPSVLRQISVPDIIVGQEGRSRSGHGFARGIKNGVDGLRVGPLDQVAKGELECPVDRHGQVKFAYIPSDLGNIRIELAGPVDLQLLPGRFVPFQIGLAVDPVMLKTTMQRRAGQQLSFRSS